ncbi:MAG: hypothetical protein LBH65_03880 [Desulfovibrio sp.]|nr:hypothetical protein [Desulfovibrio sp.]
MAGHDQLMERVMLEYHRFKAVSDLYRQGKDEEARLELAELQRRYVSLCDENTTLRMQAQEYEDILYLARNLVFDGEFYWLTTGGIRQGPFCPNCYNRDGLLMRLFGEAGKRCCGVCHESYPGLSRREEMAARGFDESQFAHAFDREPRRAKVIPFGR